jgi:FkbM family methyltransferase
MKKIFLKIRQKYFPTRWERTIAQYYAAGGDAYFRLNFDISEDALVLDLGGYKGQWASDIYAKYNCRIMIFEPFELFAEKIKERFVNNSKIDIFQFALGANARNESIGISDDGTGIFKKSTEQAHINFVDAKVFFDEEKITEVDLAKLNIEGGEYELLNRLIETKLISKIRHLQVQFHDIDASSRGEMEKIQNKLALTHSLQFRYDFVWEGWIRND